MITVLNRKLEVLCQIGFDTKSGLIAYDDTFKQDLATGISSYEFTVDKTDSELAKISAGNYIFLNDNGYVRTFEILTVEDDNYSKTIYAEDAGLDLINEIVPKYEADKSYPITHYISKFTFDSGWELGINQIPNSTTRKLSWDGSNTTTKRLKELVGRFDAEINYSIEIVNGRISKKLINIYKKIGNDNKVRLEYGREVKKITKTESIENLATALRVTGVDDLTLNGYSYNDGRFVTGGDLIYDTRENPKWKRLNATSGGYIVRNYESEAKTQERLCQEGINQLKKMSVPEITYDVDIEDFPEVLNIGDSVSCIDFDYMPPLVLEARVSTIERSISNVNKGKIQITNIVEKSDSLDDRVVRISQYLKRKSFEWNNVPVIAKIISTNGEVFKDNNVTTTLKVNLTKNDIVYPKENLTFKWKKQNVKSYEYDINWNNSHNVSSDTLQITTADVQFEARFIVEVYKDSSLLAIDSIIIKDFVVGKYEGNTPPQNAEIGDIWVDTSEQPYIAKILTNEGWTPIVKDLREQLTDEVYETIVDKTKDKLTDKLKIGTVNLLPYSKIYWGNGNIGNDGNISEDSDAFRRLKSFIPIEGNEDYIINSDSNFVFGMLFFDDHNNVVNYKDNTVQLWKADGIYPFRFKTPVNATKFKFYFRNKIYGTLSDENALNFLKKTKLERGLIVTDWSKCDLDYIADDEERSNLTQSQMEELQKQTDIRIQEIYAKAILEATRDWRKAFDELQKQNEIDKKEAERNLQDATQRIVAIQTTLGAMSQKWNFIDRDITFSNEGMKIGNPQGGNHILISDNRISMFSNGNEVMYVSQGVLHITHGIFVKSLQIGYYIWEQYKHNEHNNVLYYVGGK